MLSVPGPLRVALLCSRRAPGLLDLLRDRNAGSLYQIVCAMTSEQDFAPGHLFESAGIPLLVHPLRELCRERRVSRGNFEFRREFDAESVRLLAPYRPDVLALSGYLLILTDAALEAFPGRIVNVHGSDLALRGAGGHPRYVGLRSVRDAIFAGEPSTRATAHIVTERLDDGPILARSREFPVSPMVADALAAGAVDWLKAYAFAHQEWMLHRAWGPLLAEVLANLALSLPREEEPAPAVKAAAAGVR